MADLAEMIYGTAQNAAQNVGAGIPNALHQGAQLALQKEELDQKQQQLQMQMQQLNTAKTEKLYSFIQGAHEYTNGADRNAYLKNAYGYASAMNLPSNVLPPGSLDGLGTDENTGRLVTLQGMVAGHQISPDQYFQIVRDKEAFAKINPTPPEAIDLGKVSATPELQEVMQQQTQLKAAATRATTGTNPDKEFADFGKTLANPSTRSDMGISKQMVAAADSIKQLTDTGLPSNATKEQKVAAYNALTPQQNTEVIRSLDRLLSRSNPTVHGQESLEPGTWADLAAKYGQKALNSPVGATQGEFIYNNMQTVNRERDMNAQKFKTSANILKDTNVNAKAKYSSEMDKQIENAMAAPSVGGSDNVNFGGKTVSRAALEAYVADPSHAKNPDLAAAKQALGAK